jgi:heat shock protein HslJ
MHIDIETLCGIRQRNISMNKIVLSIVTLFVVSGLILSSCGLAGNPLKGTSWKLVSYGPADKQIPAAPGIETNLDLGTDGRVNGNVGCNSFGGNYEVKNGEILFSQMISSMMACQGSQMDQETTVLRVMNGTAHFQLQGNSLVIQAADGASAITLSK